MPTRTPEFRYVFANTLGFGLTDNEARIVFAMAEDLTKPEDAIEQVGVVLSHRTLKLMAYIIDQAIQSYEDATKTVIPLDQAKMDALKASMLVSKIVPEKTKA